MNLPVPELADDGGRPLTGRKVLLMLVAFFGSVTLVNVVMIQAAVSTFGGVDTPSSYKAGLAFKAEEAAAAAQNARHWTVDADLSPAGEGGETLTVEVKDRLGNPVRDADVTARLTHPIDERLDVAVAMTDTGSGVYKGVAAAGAGQWRLVIEIARDGERLFRSENRIVVR